MTDNDRRQLGGSDRVPLPGARRTANAGADEVVKVTVLVRPGSTENPPVTVGAGSDPRAARQARRRQVSAARAATQADLALVTSFATGHGLNVDSVDAARRTVRLSGTAASMGAAFGVDLGRYEVTGQSLSYRGREGHVLIPADLDGVVEAVLGLDDRPQARFDLKFADSSTAAAAAGQSYWATQVAGLYDFPTTSTGAGESIALIELGGGYQEADLTSYFEQLGIAAPTVVAVGVDGAVNSPGSDADGEVDLDIQVAAAVAPQAEIVVYFAPNTDDGFVDAISTAVHDEQNAPSVISISWGAAESAWTEQAMTAMDSVFADAAAAGVTVLCATGDHGAGDATTDGLAHADFPASSPHVVACGGTRLTGTSETVWNEGDGWATGGGISDVFDVPEWQEPAAVPASVNAGGHRGRGLPDIAGNADSSTGYIVVINGQNAVVGGTSAVAPLYAGLVALLNSELGRPVGELSPALYAVAGTDPSVFGDVSSGDNSVPRSSYGPAVSGYSAGPGWDACSGLGSINGTALLNALQAVTLPAEEASTVS